MSLSLYIQMENIEKCEQTNIVYIGFDLHLKRQQINPLFEMQTL